MRRASAILDGLMVAEALRRGTITKDEVATFPYKNVVTRSFGQKRGVKPDVKVVPAQLDDVYVLCSDGLTGMVSEDTICKVIEKSQDLQRATQQLIDWANAMGGTDNVTCVLIRICE